MIKSGRFVLSNTKNIKSLDLQRLLASATNAQKSGNDADKDKNYSFVANIFRGKVETSQLFPYPEVLNSEQLEHIGSFIDPVTKFFEEVNDAAKSDKQEKTDEATLQACWDLGIFALQSPEEIGGLNLNYTQYTRLSEIIGRFDLGLSVTLAAHQSIGFKGILLYGTPEQKAKYLPQVTNGRVYACFCLTEPSSGSDANSIRTRAVKSADGKHYILNGSKIWISNGGFAEIMTVFAQTEVEDPATGKKKDKVTAFIVERGFGGVTNGQPEKKMGIKCSVTTEVYFEDVKIPVENVLGGEGNGFKVAMNILNNGRFGMPGVLSGTMRACIQKATDHVTTRVQFGKKLESFGGIQEKLSKMAMLQYCTHSMVYSLAGNMDMGSKDYHLEAAIAKVFSSEAAWWVCDEAIQVLGGMGYMTDTGLERVMRDLRIFRIFEGANDVLRLFVALTGIQYAGGHLKELQRAFKQPTANLGLIFQESSKRVVRKFGYGGVDMTAQVAPALKPSADLCAGCIDQFGQAVEALLVKYGKNIVNEQFVLNRLADSAIDIYAMSVCLSRASRAIVKNFPTAEHEKLMTEAWCVEAANRVQTNLKKTSGQYIENYRRMSQISKVICEDKDVVQTHPLPL